MLTVFADGLGRLMGKRVVGRYFLDHVLDDGVHACIYLFTVDMEMEPLPGFKLASWERGYGDMKLVPDLATWRLVPWLPKTALVFCDVYTEEGEPIEEAPRWVLRRQIERAKQQGLLVQTASELELYLFKESFDEARAKRYQGLTPVSAYLEDYHILQTSREEGLVRAIRNHMEAARVPVEFSKGEWGRGQEEINLRYAEALEMADRHVLYKHGVEGNRLGSRAPPSRSWRSTTWAPPAPRATCTPPSGTARGRKNLFAAHGSRAGTPLFRHWLAGQMAMARDLALLLRADDQSYKRYQAGELRADPHRVRLGQPHLWVPPLRRGRELPGREPHPRRRRQSLSRVRRDHRCGAPRHCRRSSSHPPSTRAMRTRTRRSPRCRRRCGRPSTSSSGRGGRGALGSKVVDHYLHHGRLEQQAFDQAVTDWELIRHFERI